jgi:hypothetical protein
VKHVNTRFPDDLYEAIAAAADAEERPVGSWLRIAAKEKLARDGNLIYNAGGGEEVEFKPGPSHGFPIIATSDGIREDTAYVVSAVQDPRDPAKKKLDAVKITVSARVEVQAPHQPPYRRRVCCMWGEGSMNLLRKTVADTVLGLTLHAAKAGEPVKISLTNDSSASCRLRPANTSASTCWSESAAMAGCTRCVVGGFGGGTSEHSRRQ